MTAKVIPLRPAARPPVGQPCGSGTVPGGVSKPCGRTDTRLYAEGWRCDSLHKPQPGRHATASIFDVPAGAA